MREDGVKTERLIHIIISFDKLKDQRLFLPDPGINFKGEGMRITYPHIVNSGPLTLPDFLCHPDFIIFALGFNCYSDIHRIAR